MKFSEYVESEFYQKRLRREEGKSRAHRIDTVLLLCLIGALLVALVLIQFTSDSQKLTWWFFTLLAVCMAIFLGCLVATYVISFRYYRKGGVYMDRGLAAGLILYYRELDLHPEKFLKDGILLAEAVFPEEQQERVMWAKWGKEEGVTLLDFAPLGGVEEMQSPAAVLLILIDAMERGLTVTQASVSVYYESAVGRSEGKPLNVVKNGKLTFFARLLRFDYRRAVKFMKKRKILE